MGTRTTPAHDATSVGEPADQSGDFTSAVERLSGVSVDRHFEAAVDTDWNQPSGAIDPDDPRFELWVDDPLRATDWYARQDETTRSRLALHRMATAMRVGWELENVLQRGLLEHLYWMDERRPELRSLMYEVAEECRDMLMFQEFANRSGVEVRGMSRTLKHASRIVLLLSRTFPEAFFLFVLAGEDPIEVLQRKLLKEGGTHPATRLTMGIHVNEETPHITFARDYLRERVPRLGARRRRVLALGAPLVFSVMARVMAFPSPSTLRLFGVPKTDLRRVLHRPAGRAVLRDVVAGPRRLCAELGLLDGPSALLWRALGIGEGISRTVEPAQWDGFHADGATPLRNSTRPGAQVP